MKDYPYLKQTGLLSTDTQEVIAFIKSTDVMYEIPLVEIYTFAATNSELKEQFDNVYGIVLDYYEKILSDPFKFFTKQELDDENKLSEKLQVILDSKLNDCYTQSRVLNIKALIYFIENLGIENFKRIYKSNIDQKSVIADPYNIVFTSQELGQII